MAGEEKQLVQRHRETHRRHEMEVVAGARVVTCTLQTAMRRSASILKTENCTANMCSNLMSTDVFLYGTISSQ